METVQDLAMCFAYLMFRIGILAQCRYSWLIHVNDDIVNYSGSGQVALIEPFMNETCHIRWLEVLRFYQDRLQKLYSLDEIEFRC